MRHAATPPLPIAPLPIGMSLPSLLTLLVAAPRLTHLATAPPASAVLGACQPAKIAVLAERAQLLALRAEEEAKGLEHGATLRRSGAGSLPARATGACARTQAQSAPSATFTRVLTRV